MLLLTTLLLLPIIVARIGTATVIGGLLLLSGLVKELTLLAGLFFVATKLVLLKLVLPLFAFLLATFRAREVTQLLGVGDLKGVSAALTTKSDLL